MLDHLRVNHGDSVSLTKRDTSDSFGLADKDEGAQELARLTPLLYSLQYRLGAEARRSLLLVLQGLDASGKDGTIRRVFTGVNPQSCRVVSFKAPSDDELARDYLWRVHQRVPMRGEIGIFNRSHYEDVVAAVALGIVGDHERKQRYEHIRAFERMLTDEGTRIVKVFLHISHDEQRRRLQKRLDDPEKRWKFRCDDLDTRKQWDVHMRLYEQAIEATSTDDAPWYVLPADRKWARDVAISRLLVHTLDEMRPEIPPPAEDLDGLRVE